MIFLFWNLSSTARGRHTWFSKENNIHIIMFNESENYLSWWTAQTGAEEDDGKEGEGNGADSQKSVADMNTCFF